MMFKHLTELDTVKFQISKIYLISCVALYWGCNLIKSESLRIGQESHHSGTLPSCFSAAPGRTHVALISCLQFQAPLTLKHQTETFVFLSRHNSEDLKRILLSLSIHSVVFIHQHLSVIGGRNGS